MTAGGPLAGRSVLVTRPAHQAGALCDRLTALGATVQRFPLIAIEPIVDAACSRRALDALNDGAWAVFTSVNAVDGAHAAGLRSSHLRAGRVAAIGPATAGALRGFGVAPLIPPPPYTSETLLALPAFAPEGTVVLVKGEGGRVALAQGLADSGAAVFEWPVYRRVPGTADGKALSAWLRTATDRAAVVTSGEALERLFDIVDAADREALEHTPLVVVSTRLEALARRLGTATTILCAQGAADSLIVDALVRWVSGTSPSSGEPK